MFCLSCFFQWTTCCSECGRDVHGIPKNTCLEARRIQFNRRAGSMEQRTDLMFSSCFRACLCKQATLGEKLSNE